MQEDKKIFRILKQRPIVITVVAVAALMVIGAIVLKLFVFEEKDPTKEMPTFEVKQGPLRISIIESGTMNAREQVVIKNEVEGTTTILSLVPEGALVKKGDLLWHLTLRQRNWLPSVQHLQETVFPVLNGIIKNA